jgi:hypothetical protein
MPNREFPTHITEWAGAKPANPLDAETWPEATVRETTFTRRPETALQALMEASPIDTPEVSMEEVQVVREAVADAIDRLPERLRYVIDSINSERVSVRELGRRMNLSKSQVQRLKEQAHEQLRLLLIAHPVIRRRLDLPAENWNEAARDVVEMLCPAGDSNDNELDTRILVAIEDMRARFHLGTDEAQLFADPAFKMGRAAAGWLDNHGIWSADEMTALLCRKQRDYGHGNITAFGARGVVVRLSDKVERLKNLKTSGNTPANESLLDTYDDIVGYCTILLMLANETFNLRLIND